MKLLEKRRRMNLRKDFEEMIIARVGSNVIRILTQILFLFAFTSNFTKFLKYITKMCALDIA